MVPSCIHWVATIVACRSLLPLTPLTSQLGSFCRHKGSFRSHNNARARNYTLYRSPANAQENATLRISIIDTPLSIPQEYSSPKSTTRRMNEPTLLINPRRAPLLNGQHPLSSLLQHSNLHLHARLLYQPICSTIQ